MSVIGNLMVPEKVAEIEYPDIEGFVVTLAYISRESLIKIRDKSMKKVRNRARQMEDELDGDKFTEEYIKKVVRDWKGLKIKHLPKLLPVKIGTEDGETLIPFSTEEAIDLAKNSTYFDQFITDCVSELELFEEESRDTEEKNLESSSK